MDNLFWGEPFQSEMWEPYTLSGGFIEWLSLDLGPNGVMYVPQKVEVEDKTPVEYTEEVYHEQLMEMLMETGEFQDEDPYEAKSEAQYDWKKQVALRQATL